MDWVGLVAVVMIFGTGMLGVVAFSPIGRAISNAIQKKSGVVPSPELRDAIDDLADRFEGMQRQVSELAERQDFAERLLAQAREKARCRRRRTGSVEDVLAIVMVFGTGMVAIIAFSPIGRPSPTHQPEERRGHFARVAGHNGRAGGPGRGSAAPGR